MRESGRSTMVVRQPSKLVTWVRFPSPAPMQSFARPADRRRLASAVVAATIPIYLEVGHKRVFASALVWPGWTRAGKDEKLAIEALLAYLPRYAVVPKTARIAFPTAAGRADPHRVTPQRSRPLRRNAPALSWQLRGRSVTR